MKSIVCEKCGSNELFVEDSFFVCKYCGTQHRITEDENKKRQSSIDLHSDVERLLQRCKENPERARKCAEHILEIDPSNSEAKRIIANSESNKQNGCYVATAIYGSYDCPPVWTLRRYRDNILAKSWYGRMFIHLYYFCSPTFVRCFGNSKLFHNFLKPKLDNIVEKLNQIGIKSTPYLDREWRQKGNCRKMGDSSQKSDINDTKSELLLEKE